MSYQIFLSPQVKRSAIISNKHGMYDFAAGGPMCPHKKKKTKKLRILGN